MCTVIKDISENLIKLALYTCFYPLCFNPFPASARPVLQEQPAQANFSNICTGLEILCFLLTVLQPAGVLSHFKPLQRGIAACMTCSNTKVLRAVHSLLSRLMSIFPTEPSESHNRKRLSDALCVRVCV